MEGIESIYMHQPPTLDKFPYCLGFDTKPPDETPSFSSEPILQSPIRNPLNGDIDDDDDETTLQIIVEEVRNLVISRAFSEEIKAKSENEDEIMLQIMNEEVLNLVLSEDRAKGNGRDGVGSESVKEISENEYCGDRYEGGDGSWSKCGNVIDVENEKGGEAGSKEWGFGHYEDGDRSWMGNENVIDVENEKGVEAGSREWGFDHYGDGDRSWRGNENVVNVENDKGGEEGLKEWGFDRYEEGDRSWRGNENVIDVENEKGVEAGSREWGFNANGRGLIYPLRPDAEDCAYYLKTGTCKYGVNCKFNHPSPRRNQWAMEKGEQKEESEERSGLIECKYYLTEGGCKYGNACKYNHSRRKGAISPVMDFNFLGLPIRPGEKDCPYYMRTGSCKYGSNCRFHHPDPTTVAGNNPSFGYNNDVSAPVQSASYSPVSSWSSPQASNETAPFVPMVYSASQGIPPLGPQWNSFQAPVYPTPEKSLPTPPVFTMKDPATKTNFYPRPQQPWLVEEYHPERPGQPDCSYFLKTGDCKYKSNCKFHHPKTQKFKTNLSVLSDKGLPLRPGQAVCSFYSRCGICKFGPACKFDHPEHNDNSAASPGFAFYQPPFGNSATTDGLRMGRKGNGNGSLVQPSI